MGSDGLPATLLGTSNPVSTADVPAAYTLISFTFSSPVTVPVDFAAVITVPAYTNTSTDIVVCSSDYGTVIAGDEALPVSYGMSEWATMTSEWGATELFDLAIFPVVVSSTTIDLAEARYATFANIATDITAAFAVHNTVSVVNNSGTAFTAGSNALTIDIPSGKKVEWSAAYEGATTGSFLLNLTGSGTFEVKGGSITHNGTGAANIYTNAAVSIIVSGGAVSAVSGYGIYINDLLGSVTVSGGTVSSGTGNAIYSNQVTVSGGVVHSTTGNAIRGASGSTINVSGGVVHSTTGNAIINAGGTTNVSGGFVFAYGNDITGTGNVIYDADVVGATLNITSLGVVVAWNKTQGRTTYAAGASIDLYVEPAGTAKWGIESGKSGIRYTNGANSGFFEISGITVKEVSNTIDLKDYLTASDIEEGINFALTAHNTVYVEKSTPGAFNAGNAGPEIIIFEGKTVEWRAEYRGATSSGSLIRISTYGTGLFKVTGGSIVNTYADGVGNAIYANGDVEVSGGTVSVAGTGSAISIGDIGAPAITVSGGTVLSTDGYAIYSASTAAPIITVSGGTVHSENNKAIYSTSTNPSSSVTVSGGAVSSRDNAIVSYLGEVKVSGGTVNSIIGMAISSGGAITVSGGTVSSTTDLAIGSEVAVTVSGGFVFSYGNKIESTGSGDYDAVIYVNAGNYTLSGNGVVVAWNQKAGTTTYTAGTTDDLVSEPAGKAVWALGDGISYSYNGNSGFFPLPVTVNAPPTPATAPHITGPQWLTLTTGYAATSTGAYAITGTSPVTVAKISGNAAITWNGATNKLDIAADLPVGDYPVVLRASNSAGTHSLIFTLTVENPVYYIDNPVTFPGGTVTSDPQNLAEEGQTVTLTVTPDAGYELQTLTVTDYSGNAVALTGTGLSRTFRMPANHVTIAAVFRDPRLTANDELTIDTGQLTIKTYVQNGVLYISGLKAGETWNVYNITGTLIYQAPSNSPQRGGFTPLLEGTGEASLRLPSRGVYIVRSGNKAIKVSY